MKLGRYEVVRELGKGAMGVVYLAKDPVIGRLVALKTIRVSAHADDEETKEFQQRFVREAQAAGILNHPAIVTVHDIGQDDAGGTSFIAMEYVEGNNLKEVLAQGRALSFEQIGDLVAQVADALDFAHSKGIVHRDVKPANIILIEGNRAKITDFGIAKIASGTANLTTTGQFLGTPNYMAPEQIKGAPVDGRTDIFSLGICLYECLTRRKPFGGDSLTSISYKIVHEAFPPLHEINPTIPEGFSEVVSHCLAKDPAKRYQRGRDLAAALRAVLRGERPSAVRDPVLEEVTMVTRADHHRPAMPTVDIPFPQAQEASGPGLNTRPAVVPPAPAPAPAAPAVPKTPVSKQLRTTLTNVRAMPLWRQRVPPAIFFGIIAILVAGLIAAVAAVRSKSAAGPPADMNAWAKAALMRQLRGEANSLLARGRVTDAYPKFEELSQLAPKSPYVQSMLERLNAMKLRDELTKQQVGQAKAKFDEGVAFFNAKQFPQAIQKFQESFDINPGSIETGDYLRLAQQEQQKLDAARAASRTTQRLPAQTASTTRPAQTTTTQTAAPAVPSTPAQLTTTFTHPFTDGRIIVRAGADVVANEPLFTVRKGGFLRRTANLPRPVNVTHEFTAKNADVDILITVPALNINEHKTLPFRFQPGTAHRLVVRYDAGSKNFSYELN
ncbi:MAG TPA: serine/threonine-protein kinase [Thermoanaerobaculia bacterium]|nr:serine/threonine-protein kinase [Thermoanaerobaculia bacterium]